MSGDATANIFVGSDRSQLLAVKVLEHSIRRHTTLDVRLRSMHDLNLPDPKDIRQGKRTGFSFTRFAIPQLMAYRDRAVYLDADMLVFRDFRELYEIPFNGAKVVIQEEPPNTGSGRKKRIKQCSVMLLDCAALDWDPREIIAGLDGRYTYEELMQQLCILDERETAYDVPFEWNSLEHYEPGRTGLIHYTDMNTQPWVHPGNPNGHLWVEEVRLMLENGALSPDELEAEVRAGYFRPSLLAEIEDAGAGPAGPATSEQVARYAAIDAEAGYVKHAAVNEANRARIAAVRAYELELAKSRPLPAALAQAGRTRLGEFARAAARLIGR